MSRISQKKTGDRKAPTRAVRSAVRQAMHGVFDDLRREPGPDGPGRPFVATLCGMPHSGRSSAVTSYIFSRAASDAMERGLFPAGTPESDVKSRQDLVVDISVPELLTGMPANVFAEALRQPALFLQRTRSLVRHGITELVLLEGVGELLQQAIDAHGNVGNLDIAIGIEAARGFARMVGTPVVHVCDPIYRNTLSEDPVFCRTWRWEVDTFSMGEDQGANADYMLERFRSLGFLAMERGAYPVKPDPTTGNMPGLVFNAGGQRVGVVSPAALAEAVKSCGPGSVGFAIDLRKGTSFAAILHFEPMSRLTAAERVVPRRRMN
jgi:hypothetical protein